MVKVNLFASTKGGTNFSLRWYLANRICQTIHQ